MTETVTVGPFGLFFTNVNQEMKLPGHSHSGTLTLEFLNIRPMQGEPGSRGFPAFAETYEAITRRLIELTAKPFRDSTNEEVARRLFDGFYRWTAPEIDKWGGRWILLGIELGVQGVRDRIGHADGVTRYRVYRTEKEATDAYHAWRFTR